MRSRERETAREKEREMRWDVKGIQVRKCLTLISNSVEQTQALQSKGRERAKLQLKKKNKNTYDEFAFSLFDGEGDETITQRQS